MTPDQAGFLSCVGVIAVAALFAKALQNSRKYRVQLRVQQVRSLAVSWVRIAQGFGVLVLTVSTVYSPQVAIIAVPVAVGLGWYLRCARHSRSIERYEQSIPLALEAVASGMRSGAGLLIALEDAGNDLSGPVADDLLQLTRKVRHGLPIESALQDWSLQRKLPSVALVSASLSMAVKTGAAHAEVVDRVALSVRQSLSAIASAKTHAAQAHASAWALTLLPLVVTGPMLIFNSSTREFLLHTWIGTAVLASGIALDAAGAVWMTRLTNRTLK